jgi:hypothetical protein
MIITPFYCRLSPSLSIAIENDRYCGEIGIDRVAGMMAEFLLILKK